MPRIQRDRTNSEEVRRSSKKQCIETVEAKCCDDRGKEVRHTARGDDTSGADHQEPGLCVLERKPESMEERLLCTSSPVVETDVFFEADDGLVFVVSSEIG